MYVGWYVIELIEVHLKPQADETPWIFLPAFFLHTVVLLFCEIKVALRKQFENAVCQCQGALELVSWSWNVEKAFVVGSVLTRTSVNDWWLCLTSAVQKQFESVSGFTVISRYPILTN